MAENRRFMNFFIRKRISKNILFSKQNFLLLIILHPKTETNPIPQEDYFFYHKMAKSAAHLPRFLLRSVLQGKQTSASSQFSRALHRDASVVSQQAQVKQEK